MNKRSILVILSGSLCTGKSTLSNNLAMKSGYYIFKSKNILKKLIPANYVSKYSTEREGLINYCLELDSQTNGSWLAENLSSELIERESIIIDCVRLNSQLEAIRRKFSDLIQIRHIHLKCAPDILINRFSNRNENNRSNSIQSHDDFKEAKEHTIELQTDELETKADLVINTDYLSPLEVFIKVNNYLTN